MATSKKLYFLNKSRGKLLASEANVADNFLTRLIGLLNTPSLVEGQGLYITACSQIHMFGMKYAIDVVFLDKQNRVVGLCDSIKPGQMSKLFLKAQACLELPPGIIRSTATTEGDEIEFAAAPYKAD
ncbi:MAG: DUF192 domain-containing protein [Candidatus Obscuribacterales bacterium]|nr:DUF192 domain-containing protein [Candidatus Obscuribacterales bacterium]